MRPSNGRGLDLDLPSALLSVWTVSVQIAPEQIRRSVPSPLARGLAGFFAFVLMPAEIGTYVPG